MESLAAATVSGQRRRRPSTRAFPSGRLLSLSAGGAERLNRKKRAEAENGIPDDALVEVLSRLPVKPLHRSKCVAKAWLELIDGPHHRKKLPQTLEGFFFMDEESYSSRRNEGRFGFIDPRPRSVPLDIDPSFYFLMKRPEIKVLTLSDSCNGLLLLEHGLKLGPPDRFGYIVCNPATKQWVTVPKYDSPPAVSVRCESRYNYLVFDPAVSSHFHLVQFWLELMQKDEDGSSSDSEESEDSHDAWYRYKYGTWTPGSLSDYADNQSEFGEEEAWQRYKYGTWTPGSIDDWTNHRVKSREEVSRISVHTYSSETGMWSHMPSDWDEHEEQGLEGWRHKGLIPCQGPRRAVVNGMLHFIISGQDEIAAVDVQGTTKKLVPVPKPAEGNCWGLPGYIAQSQGRLHYINQEFDAHLSIWVLKDYDAKKWVLKHRVKLFGKKRPVGCKNGYHVVAMHPDGNVIFIVQSWNLKLISYDMDHKLVRVIGTVKDESCIEHVMPYVPHFFESSVLTNKH
ncbi:hypothetical protein QOZ80_7BG0589960 [Eleusine coracana subsp. coracana]|nr:hypothetical protein QOZ80_7BG0589960 [Eleusine coracana subsp. coracana]